MVASTVATYGLGGKKTLATLGFGEIEAGVITWLETVEFTLDMEPTSFDFILDSGVPSVIQTSYIEVDNIYVGTTTYTFAYGDDEFFVQLFQADRTGIITKLKARLSWAFEVNSSPCRIGICACDQGTHHPLYPKQWIGYGEVDTSDMAEHPTMTTVEVAVNCPVVAGTWYGMLVWSAEPVGEYRTMYTTAQNGVADENAHRTTNGGSTWANFGSNCDIPCYAEQGELNAFVVTFTLDMEPTAFEFTLDVIE